MKLTTRTAGLTRTAAQLAAMATLATASVSAFAAPITVSAVITGDQRLAAQYQDLRIEVTITSDTTSNTASWTVDIASPAHPNAKLDEFYFNMAGAAGSYTFSGFNPAGWAISSPASTAGGGSFSPSFVFEALDPAGPPNAADVTNTQNLSFTMTKSSGNFTANDFLLAALSTSTDRLVGSGQLGAHLQALQQGASGFLIGNYSEGTLPPAGTVPEPLTLGLVGIALLGLAASRRRA